LGLLIYGTGGLAFLKEKQLRDQYRYTDYAAGTWGRGTDLSFVEQLKLPRIGLTLGGGAEYAINDRWSIKAEYTYSHFPRKEAKFEKARAGTGLDYEEQVGSEWVDPSQDPGMAEICVTDPVACTPYDQPIYGTHTGSYNVVNGRNTTSAIDLHVIKVGLNYRF